MRCSATLGGQTALNLAKALHDDGTLDRYGVELIGVDYDAIQPRRGPRALPRDDAGRGAEASRARRSCTRSRRPSGRSTRSACR